MYTSFKDSYHLIGQKCGHNLIVKSKEDIFDIPRAYFLLCVRHITACIALFELNYYHAPVIAFCTMIT